MSEICKICSSFLNSDIVTVKEKGLRRMISASLERGDAKHILLEGLRELRLHRKCRLLYIDRKSIAAHKNKTVSQESISNQAGETFDFATCCIFCNEIADNDFIKAQTKYPVDTRITVSRVTKKETQMTILQAATTHNDDWSKTVLLRVTNVNLLEKGAVYHLHCYKKFCHPYRAVGLKRGRTQSSDNSIAMDRIYNFLETNNDDSQFSLSEIRNALSDVELPSDQVIKYNLKQKYGAGIIITSGKPSVICFIANSVHKIQSSWYEARNKNDILERQRIVDAAARIILEDLRSRVYETEMYPAPTSFLNDAREDCPESLLRFLKIIIINNKTNCEPYERKCVALTHAIVSAARPRTFRSPVLIGLSSLLHHKYASRYLIDLLSGMGFCATYEETLKFQVSAIASYAPKESSPNFTQFVFDNADVNVQTLDGHNTFHTMGGIQCLNPPQTPNLNDSIPRLQYVPQSFLKRFDQVPMQTYFKPKQSGLDTIFQASVENNNSSILSKSDLLWMYGKSEGFPDMPGWNTFMSLTHKEQINCDKMSEIKPLPFINAPASSYDTILTALCYATEHCNGIECCIVTFDQPLYQKAQEIVKSSKEPKIRKIILRLGGFHLLMSFMGAVGQIMNGSGLKELWAGVYAIGSLDKMMVGHHYDRAVRAHLLTSVALFGIIMKGIELSINEKLELSNTLHGILDRTDTDINIDTELIISKFSLYLNDIEKRGPTAELWVSYFKMTLLIQHFIKAERTGNWALHLITIRKMLPYFHAAGHFNYAKSASLYLQDMESLESLMTPTDYQKFVEQQLFTIRRTQRPCSGTWSDMTIEQSLMRSMKTSGGVTQGRGLSDNVLGKWVLGLPILHSIAESVENFSDATDTTIYSHKDGSVSRIARDAKDVDCFSKWFDEHNPFPDIPDIMSISTGLIGGSNINPHKAREIGENIMKNRTGLPFSEIKYSRKETIQSLATLNSVISVQETKVPIEPDLIFKRISFVKKSQEELKTCLKFELSPYPLSLFDQKGMRKTNKSAFYEMFTPITENEPDCIENKAHVIDGGFLLHRVVWQKGLTFSIICKKYVDYVEKFMNPTVIFDGYENQLCVKRQERIRRANGKFSANVIFQENTESTMSQEKFLSNDKNKSRLIDLLTKYLTAKDIPVFKSVDDADTLIVSTATKIADTKQYEKVLIIGEDIDLLTILTMTKCSKVWMMKLGRGKIPTKLYKADSFNGDPHIVAFAHAFTGCDTTSAIFKQGKKKVCSKITNSADLKQIADIFNDPSATPNDIAKAGEKIFSEIYGGKTTDLNTLRYEKFALSITKSTVDQATLPPTASAAKQHSLRVYYQVQKWLFNDLNPIDWGWEMQALGLVPVTSLDNPAPDDILKMISCKCKFTCKGTCTCIKAGLRCTALCINCVDKTCNSDRVIDEGDFDVETELQMSTLHDEDFREKSSRVRTNSSSIPKVIEEACFEESVNVPSCSGLHNKSNKRQKCEGLNRT